MALASSLATSELTHINISGHRLRPPHTIAGANKPERASRLITLNISNPKQLTFISFLFIISNFVFSVEGQCGTNYLTPLADCSYPLSVFADTSTGVVYAAC